MANFISNRQKTISIGISNYTEGSTVLDVTGNVSISGIVTAKTGSAVTYYGDGSNLTGIAVTNSPQLNDEVASYYLDYDNFFNTPTIPSLDGIEPGATADQTAAEILTAIKTVDGSGSGLDADTLDGQEGSYYTGYTDTAIANLVDSSPGTLDTLNELAAALGDDANFSTTVTNSIATKLPLAGGQMTGDIDLNGNNIIEVEDIGLRDRLYHDGDTNTAIRFPADDTFSVDTAGSERLRITSAGNIGIGSASPEAKLDVISGSNALIAYPSGNWASRIFNQDDSVDSGGLVVANRYINSASSIFQAGSLYPDTGSAGGNFREFFRITGNGSVGIGNTSPAAKFVVSDNGDNGIEINPNFNSGQSILTSYNRDTSAYTDITISANQHIFAEGGTERMRIDSSGRLLLSTSSARSNIATRTPQMQLEGTSANGSSFSVIRNSNDNGSSEIHLGKTRGTSVGQNTIVLNNDPTGRIEFTGSDGTNLVLSARIAGEIDGTPGANDMPGRLVFLTTADGGSSPTERMRIASDGVIIAQKSASFGNTSDSFTAVNIKSSTSGISELRFADTTANAGYVKYEHSGNNLIFATNATERLRITSAGNIGIGIDSPQGKLHVESAATTAGWQFRTDSFGLNNESGFYRDASDNYELVLRNGLGGLSFIKNSGGSSTSNLVMTVQGSERLRIASAGQIGLGGANYGTSGQVITSNGSGSAPTWQNVGSNSNAGTLDNLDSTQFLRSDANDTATGAITFTNNTAISAEKYIGYSSTYNYKPRVTGGIGTRSEVIAAANLLLHADQDGSGTTEWLSIRAGAGTANELKITSKTAAAGQSSSALTYNGGQVWHAGNDGAGSGLDADTVDGLHSDQVKIRDARDDGELTPTNFTDTVASFTFTDDIASSTRTWDSVLTMKGWSGSTYRVWQLMGNASTVGNTDTNLYFREGIGSTWGSLQKIWTSGNDGSGSGLDADLLDGIDSGGFLRSDAADTASGNLLFSSNYTRFVSGNTNNTSTADTNGLYIHVDGTYEDGRYTTRFRKYDDGGGVPLYIDNSDGTANVFTATARFGTYSGNDYEFEVFGDINATGNLYDSGNAVWHVGNDGSGSGLDADTLDGIQGSSFLRSDAADTVSGNISFTSTTTPITTNSILFNNTEDDGNYYTSASGVLAFDENFYNDVNYGTGTYAPDTVFTGGDGGGLLIKNQDGWGAVFTSQNTRWASAQWANLKVDTNQVWHAGNDGSGSGLDADTVDGVQASSFLRSDLADTSTQRISFQANATNNWDTIATASGSQGCLEVYNTGAGNDAFMTFHTGGDYALYFGLDADSNSLQPLVVGQWVPINTRYGTQETMVQVLDWMLILLMVFKDLVS